jgi:RND family efflux transporter MFP subunit
MRLAIAAALVAALALPACKGGDGKSGAAPAGSGQPGKGGGRRGAGSSAVYPVDVIDVTTQKVNYQVSAPGTIDAFERVQITSRVGGTVDRVGFSLGQEIKKGQVLVVIDAERAAVTVDSARANVEKAKAALADVEGMIQRRQGASEKHPGLIPGEEISSLEAKALSAKADVAVAQATLRSAQVNLRDASVRAPMDGVIQTKTVETGQYVQAGYVMATLLRAEPLLLRFDVTPQEAPRIKPGATAEFTLRESKRTYSAKITLVGGAADPESHMVPIVGEVVPEGGKYWLRPGSFCDVLMNIGAQRDAPVIPRGAVRASERGLIAYVVEQGQARERVLELGMATRDGWVEVREGLQAGEKLVVRGAEALSPGAKVKESAVTLPPPGSSAAPAAGSAVPGAGPPPVGSGEPATGAPPAGSGGGRRRDRGGDKPPPAPPAGAP